MIKKMSQHVRKEHIENSIFQPDPQLKEHELIVHAGRYDGKLTLKAATTGSVKRRSAALLLAHAQ